MNKVVSNPMRTAAQGGIAWTIVDFLEAFYLVALEDHQKAPLIAMLAIAISIAHNIVDEYEVTPPLPRWIRRRRRPAQTQA